MPDRVKILIVDDEPANLLALEAVLESPKLVLVRANSGVQALRCLMKEDFAVILLDVQMPGMDGFEFAGLVRLREKNRYTPIIFLTAAGKTETEMFRGYEAGAVDYLLKPFSPTVLHHKVGVFVELYLRRRDVVRLNAELDAANASLNERVLERTAALETRSLELQRSNQELAQFAVVASHDLQEPLRTLSTYLQMFRENNQGQFSDEDEEFMQVVLDSAKRMRVLINDVMAFSQVGQGERRAEAVDSGALVQRILGLLRHLIDQRGAKVSVGPLPTIHAEPQLLGQVFQNLIENALKFQPGEAPSVDLSAQEKDGTWVFAVKDRGLGIKEEYFDKIFKLFQRLHSRAEYPGTGLGLSICKKAVERQGGALWVESTVGQGSTFYFSIPTGGLGHGTIRLETHAGDPGDRGFAQRHQDDAVGFG